MVKGNTNTAASISAYSEDTNKVEIYIFQLEGQRWKLKIRWINLLTHAKISKQVGILGNFSLCRKQFSKGSNIEDLGDS